LIVLDATADRAALSSATIRSAAEVLLDRPIALVRYSRQLLS
jgi:hypothetical protein